MAMEASPTKRGYIRLNALRLLLSGTPRATVCQIFCRSDRMVRLWIKLFNRGGIDALRTKKPGGRKRKVKLERVRDLLVPDPGGSRPGRLGPLQDRRIKSPAGAEDRRGPRRR